MASPKLDERKKKKVRPSRSEVAEGPGGNNHPLMPGPRSCVAKWWRVICDRTCSSTTPSYLATHPRNSVDHCAPPASVAAWVTAWRRWIIYCSGCDTWGVAILSSFMRSWKKKKKNTDKTNRNYPGNNVTCAQLDARWENSVFSVLSKVLFTCSDVTMRSLGSALLLAVYAGCFSRQFCSWSWCWTTSACAALNHSLFTVSAVSYSYCCRCRRRDIKQSKELDMCEVWSLDYVWNWMSISLLSSQTKMPLYLSLLVTKAYECACTHTRTHTAFKMKMFI